MQALRIEKHPNNIQFYHYAKRKEEEGPQDGHSQEKEETEKEQA